MKEQLLRDATYISSTDNPHVKRALQLRDKRHRDETGCFLIEGFRELERAYEGKVAMEMLFICPEFFLGTNEWAVIQKIVSQGYVLKHASEKVFSRLSYRDRPDGLLAVAKKMNRTLSDLEQAAKEKVPLFVVAEAIEKPGNLGTILRTADAAGAHGVIVTCPRTDIYNPNVVRASVGTLFTLPVVETTNDEAIAWLHAHAISVLAAMPEAKVRYTDADMKVPIAIALGTEQLGLSPLWAEQATVQVRIPMFGRADSLNVAQAGTILLYEAVRQRSNGR